MPKVLRHHKIFKRNEGKIGTKRKGNSIKMLSIGVMATCINGKYQNQLESCYDTWFNDESEDEVFIEVFIGNFRHSDFPDCISLPNVNEDYESAYHKQFRGLQWLYQNRPADFYMIVGSDTFVDVEKLLDVLEGYNANEDLYLGGHGAMSKVEEKEIYFHSGGGGFILSSCTAKKIVENIERICTHWFEVCTANLRPAGDVAIAYYLDEMKIEGIKNENFYSCDNTGYSRGYRCCADKINKDSLITCHYMTPEQMRAYWKEVTDKRKEEMTFLLRNIDDLSKLPSNSPVIMVTSKEEYATIWQKCREMKILNSVYISIDAYLSDEELLDMFSEVNPFSTTYISIPDGK